MKIVLVCSAGVGRTGTLVALDSLVMELDEEGQASIFNLICDLRHQRNFLVQSLVSHCRSWCEGLGRLIKVDSTMWSKKYIQVTIFTLLT